MHSLDSTSLPPLLNYEYSRVIVGLACTDDKNYIHNTFIGDDCLHKQSFIFAFTEDFVRALGAKTGVISHLPY